jgi:hypothetical protein
VVSLQLVDRIDTQKTHPIRAAFAVDEANAPRAEIAATDPNPDTTPIKPGTATARAARVVSGHRRTQARHGHRGRPQRCGGRDRQVRGHRAVGTIDHNAVSPPLRISSRKLITQSAFEDRACA